MTGRRRAVSLMFVLATVMVLPAASATAQEKSVSRPFAPGGQIRLSLSAGDYTIRPGSDQEILVSWEADTPERLAAVRVDIDTRGAEATITTRGPRSGLSVVIQVPARSDLAVQLTAGDLRIRGIEGNKDVGSWAGDIDIDVGDPNDYASVSASLTAGDLTATAFDVSKGGVFRSFTWNGPGRYTLRVRLTAGDIRLH
jgi:hypothetical protein